MTWKVGGKGSPPSCSFSCNGKIIARDSDTLESFCDFFTDIGPRLAQGVQTPASGSFRDFLGPPSGSSAFFWPTTPAEVESICQALDPLKGPGHDGFSPSVFRFASSKLAGLGLSICRFKEGF